jgi:hypothetical protein
MFPALAPSSSHFFRNMVPNRETRSIAGWGAPPVVGVTWTFPL